MHKKTFAIIGVLINSAAAVGKVILASQEQIADARKSITAGQAAVAQGTAMLPLNPIVGGALIGTGTAATTAGTALLAKVQINKGLQLAAIGITAGAQIAAITAAGKGGKTSSSGAGGASAGATTPAFTSPVQAQVPNIGVSAVSSEGRIGDIVSGAATEQGRRPIQTYVVGSQVTSQQQLDRRVALAAKMPG